MPSRRDVLATSTGALAVLAGCASEPPGTPPERSPPTESPTDSPGGAPGDRPTASPRDSEPLSVSGTWPQRGGGPGHAGVTDATGAPASGRVHWHLRRVRSGPVALADGGLFHYAKLGEETDGPPTLTRTREPDAGTAHPIYGVPAIVARDAGEGRIRWTAELPDEGVGMPAVGGETVAATSRGWVGALDTTDGAERWSRDLDGRPVGEPTVAGDALAVPMSGISGGGDGDPAVAPEVRVYDLADGTERWTASPPERGLGLAVGGDTVVVVSHAYDGSGTVLGLSLADGSERWRTAIAGNFFEGPVVAGGTAYVAAGGGHLRALALADGSERWTTRKAGDGVAAGADAVYTVDGSALFARDPADGAVRWSFERDAERFVTPAAGAETVYVGGNFADLHALDPDDGTERWSHSFPDQTVEGDMIVSGLQSQPAVAEGAVYAFAADGLYAFGPDG